MNVNFLKNGTTLTVKPEGRMDIATSPELYRQIQPELEGVTAIIMDLEKVEYVSSAGLRLLLELEQRMGELGGGITVTHANKYIMEIFDITGVRNILHVE